MQIEKDVLARLNEFKVKIIAVESSIVAWLQNLSYDERAMIGTMYRLQNEKNKTAVNSGYGETDEWEMSHRHGNAMSAYVWFAMDAHNWLDLPMSACAYDEVWQCALLGALVKVFDNE